MADHFKTTDDEFDVPTSEIVDDTPQDSPAADSNPIVTALAVLAKAFITNDYSADSVTLVADAVDKAAGVERDDDGIQTRGLRWR